MIDKKDFILSLLEANNEQRIHGKSRLLKMLYLLGNEIRNEEKDIHYYNFSFNAFQPSSEEIQKDLNNLIEKNFVKKEESFGELPFGYYIEKNYSITDNGVEELKKASLSENERIMQLISELKECYNDMPLSMLIQEVNNKNPMYCHLMKNKW
jgi:uncharacterized protein YwgA